jgi:hypothetical protein
MTIQVTIKNEDSRTNAVIEVLSTDTYSGFTSEGNAKPTHVHTVSQAVLKGGEEARVYVTSTMTLQVIERQNG